MKKYLFLAGFFAMAFVSCRKENIEPTTKSRLHYIYYSLAGQKRIMTCHQTVWTSDVSFVTTTTMDTLVFNDATGLTWNGSRSTYSLYSNDEAESHHVNVLQLNDSPFGAVYAEVPLSFDTATEVDDVRFFALQGDVTFSADIVKAQ